MSVIASATLIVRSAWMSDSRVLIACGILLCLAGIAIYTYFAIRRKALLCRVVPGPVVPRVALLVAILTSASCCLGAATVLMTA